MKDYIILAYSSVRNEWIVVGESDSRDDAVRDFNVAKGMYLHVRMMRAVVVMEHNDNEEKQ